MAESKLDVHTFGKALLAAGDLDPVYTILWNVPWRTANPSTFRQWLLSYWCFYHVGTASWCISGWDGATSFWERMRAAAASKEYPRSAERRHFRAANAVKSVEYLAGRGLMGLWSDLDRAGPTAREVCSAVQEWVGFGPWISFKVADMLERLDLRPVTFDLHTAMYEGSPQESARALYQQHHPGQGQTPRTEQVKWAVDYVLSGLPEGDAPPRPGRPLSFQEAETVLCKHKSYLGGHYHVGEDVASVRAGLLRFAGCRSSQDLIKAGKVGGLW